MKNTGNAMLVEVFGITQFQIVKQKNPLITHRKIKCVVPTRGSTPTLKMCPKKI